MFSEIDVLGKPLYVWITAILIMRPLSHPHHNLHVILDVTSPLSAQANDWNFKIHTEI